MKHLLLLALIIAGISCKPGGKEHLASNSSPAESQAQFDWLLGNWIRTNEAANTETRENWSKKNQSEYIGFGFTIQNKDTIWQENIRLSESNGQWSFDVAGKGETEPTKFRVTNIGKQKFSCENQANEFPKVIAYSQKGDQLHAEISGNDVEIPFEFEKIREQ
jgi:hypothetical protein